MLSQLRLILNLVTNERLRRDVRSLNLAKKTYAFHAWKLLESVGLAKELENGTTIKQMLKRVRHRHMLEAALDFLVGAGALGYVNGRYSLIKKPQDVTATERAFLNRHYHGSIKWSDMLFRYAKRTLVTGKPHRMTGFSSEVAIELWDSVMEGSLYSLRRMAVGKVLRGLPAEARIADLGCGSGIAITDMIMLSKSELNVTGFDYSKEMLKKTEERIRRLSRAGMAEHHSRNAKNVELIHHDISKPFGKRDKFDAVFMSIVLNHIPREKRESSLRHIKKVMKPNTRLVIFQLVNKSKFNRVFSDWLMFVVPSHHGFPFRDEYLKMLEKNFSSVRSSLDGMIVEAKI